MSIVSVIVPTLNEFEHIEKLLSSLRDQTSQPLDITVVDGGSTDGTVAVAAAFDANVISEPKLAEWPSRNLGVEQSTGDIILFTSADVVLKPKVIENIQRWFADPDLLALTGPTYPDTGSILWKAEYWLLRFACYGVSVLPRPLKKFPTTTNLLAVRRSAFHDAGGFKIGDVNADGLLGLKLVKKGKVRFAWNVRATISPRRIETMGFIRFNLHFAYVLEDFFPFIRRLPWFGRAAAQAGTTHSDMRREEP